MSAEELVERVVAGESPDDVLTEAFDTARRPIITKGNIQYNGGTEKDLKPAQKKAIADIAKKAKKVIIDWNDAHGKMLWLQIDGKEELMMNARGRTEKAY